MSFVQIVALVTRGVMSNMRSAVSLVVAGLIVLGAGGAGHADPARGPAAPARQRRGRSSRASSKVQRRPGRPAATERPTRPGERPLAPMQGQVDEGAERETDEVAAALVPQRRRCSTRAHRRGLAGDAEMDELATLGPPVAPPRRRAAIAEVSAARPLPGSATSSAACRPSSASSRPSWAERKTDDRGQVEKLGWGRVPYARPGALHDGLTHITDDAAGRAVKFTFSQLGEVSNRVSQAQHLELLRVHHRHLENRRIVLPRRRDENGQADHPDQLHQQPGLIYGTSTAAIRLLQARRPPLFFAARHGHVYYMYTFHLATDRRRRRRTEQYDCPGSDR